MEMRRRAIYKILTTGIIALLLLLLQGWHSPLMAQPFSHVYTIKEGKMYIRLDKLSQRSALDSFINKFGLADIGLRQLIEKGIADSLKKAGWEILVNDPLSCIVTKPLGGPDNMANPADRIRFAEKKKEIDLLFPSVSNSVIYGYNRLRNKVFTIRNDSIVIFFLRDYLNAKKVTLAGSFNSWDPEALYMTRTDSGWIAFVKLTPGKYWYKFLPDGNWMTDEQNRLSENDGLGNVNSVFYKTNHVFRLNGYTNARRVFVSGSFNDWRPRELEMNKTANGWELPMYLADGTHTYRFVVDGNWMVDPANPDRLPNEFQEFNSVVTKGNPIVFKLRGLTDAKQVVLAGTFNKWRKDELFMKKTATGWEIPYVLGPGNYSYKFFADGKEVQNPIVDISKGNSSNPTTTSLILQANYTFRLKGFANAKRVFLAGDFNDWDPASLPMKKEGSDWVLDAHLSRGKHLYKFIIDGRWIIDPGNKLWEQNEFGTGNSVLWIGDNK